MVDHLAPRHLTIQMTGPEVAPQAISHPALSQTARQTTRDMMVLGLTIPVPAAPETMALETMALETMGPEAMDRALPAARQRAMAVDQDGMMEEAQTTQTHLDELASIIHLDRSRT